MSTFEYELTRSWRLIDRRQLFDDSTFLGEK